MEAVLPLALANHEPLEGGPPTTSVEHLLAELLAGLMKDQLNTQDLVQDARHITLQAAKQHRQDACVQLHRAARHMHLRAAAEQLECEASTWNLVYHLLCSTRETTLDAATGHGGPMLHGCGSKVTRRQRAAEVVGRDRTLDRCARVVAWLEAEADSALTAAGPQYFSTTDGIWQDTLVQRGRGNITKELDFDAPFREGRALGASDMKAQERFMGRLWQLLRAGRMDLALKLCAEVGQPWRAASLMGGGGFGPLPVGNAAKAQDAFMLSEYQAEDLAAEMELGLGDLHAMWKWSCLMVAEETAQAVAGSKFEAAVYGALCGHVLRMLPVCSSWHDRAWAYTRAWLDLAVDSKLNGLMRLPEDQVDFHLIAAALSQCKDGALSEPQQATLQEGLAVASGSWPLPHLAGALPPTFEGIFTESLANTESELGLRAQTSTAGGTIGGGSTNIKGGAGAGAPHWVQHIRLQTDLILEDSEVLLTQHLWPWVTQHQAELAVAQVDVEGSVPSSPAYLMLRFGAHLALALKGLCVFHWPSTSPADATFSPLADCCNSLIHQYVEQLLARRHFNLLPLYVVHLRPSTRVTFINHLFTGFTTSGVADEECMQLYEWMARWFRLVFKRQEAEDEDSIGLVTNIRVAELEDIVLTVVGDVREDTSCGPLHRVRLARWLLYPFLIWLQQQHADATAPPVGSTLRSTSTYSSPTGGTTPRALHPDMEEKRSEAEDKRADALAVEEQLLQHSLFVCMELSLFCRQLALGGKAARMCGGVLVMEVLPREFLEFVQQRGVGLELEAEAAELLQWCNFFNLQARWRDWGAECRRVLMQREVAGAAGRGPQPGEQEDDVVELSTSGMQLLEEFVQQLQMNDRRLYLSYWVPTQDDVASALSQADPCDPIQISMLLTHNPPEEPNSEPQLDAFPSLTGAQLAELQGRITQELGQSLPSTAELEVGLGPTGKLATGEQIQGLEVVVSLPHASSDMDIGAMVASIAGLLSEQDAYSEGEGAVPTIQLVNLDTNPTPLGLCVAKTCCLADLVITAAKLFRALVRLGADLSVGDDFLEVVVMGGDVGEMDTMLNALPPTVLQQVLQLVNDAYIFHLRNKPPQLSSQMYQ